MTEIRDNYTNHWISERLQKNCEELNPGWHFYEDDDPRIRIVTDRWDEEVILVGYSDPIKLLNREQPGWILGVRIRDHCLMGWHPKSIDQAEYPEYVSKPYVHPDYKALNEADTRRKNQRRRENAKKEKLIRHSKKKRRK